MRWTLKPKPDSDKLKALQEALQVEPVVASLLVQRGIKTYEDAKSFFRPTLEELHDPFLMKDMDKAVARIEEAIANKESILVYGDYDVDGTTSVALMSSYLKTKHNLVYTYIPNRYDEGYGISYKGINFALENGFSLIIALDCGIKSVEKVAHAKTLGIDFIICDHHRPAAKIPEAAAVLDPKRTDCEYPFKELYAAEINDYNLDRRETDKRITKEALQQIEDQKEQNRLTTVVYHENWHKGVIGIVASRMIETYYRPTLVFTKSGNKLAASARSIRGFDVYNALENCKEHLVQFGGHKYAAGLTLEAENYEAFKQAFEDEVSKTIDRSLLTPEINIDAAIDLKDITPKFYRILKQFAPYGPSNMTPVFVSENLIDTGYGKCVGEDKTHLRLTATQPESSSRMVGIGFGMGDKFDLISDGKPFKAVYSIDENEWKGNVSLQLKLRDLKKQK